MSDAATIAIAELGNPDQYEVKRAVPIFRAHTRRVFNEETGAYETKTVTEADLPVIAEHMRALEAEGRAFRLTEGHINPKGTEAQQPRLLGFQRNARFGTFGPEKVPCVLVDEYARREAIETLKNRPYRSAEFYRESKKITGAAALLRDPELNLGIVLYHHTPARGRDGATHYSATETPWYYAEPIMADEPKNDDLSPEEVEQYEKMCRYIAQKFPKVFAAAPGLPGGDNTAVPDGKKKDEQAMNFDATTQPELYALQQRLDEEKRQREKDRAALERVQKERDLEKVNGLLDRLESIEKFEINREETKLELLAADEAGRQRIAARIRRFHPKRPGEEPIEVYAGDVEGGNRERETTREQGEQAVKIATKEGVSYDEALARVRGKK
jgi:hypothetical protein